MMFVALFGLFLASSAAIFALTETNATISRAAGMACAISATAIYALVLYVRPDPPLIGGLIGLVAAGFVGGVFGADLIATAPGLVAFLVTASIVDTVSVYAGPTQAIIEAAQGGSNNILLYLAVLLPQKTGYIPALGVSDLFGIAVVFSSLRQLGFPRISVYICGTSGIMLALVAGLIVGGAPGYPFLAVVVAIYLVWNRTKHGTAA